MSIPDEDRFETYLRRFAPLAPGPLPQLTRQEPRRHFVVSVAVAAAAVALAGWLGVHDYRAHVSGHESNTLSTAARGSREPLTLRTADAMLRSHTSYKDALEDIASSENRHRVPADKQSALAVLAKERIKL